jgi:hypothetical protein
VAFPTRDEFIKFLNDKQTRSCEACGVNNWIVPTESGGLVAYVPTATNIMPTPSIPCGVAVCSNCGNIRLHAFAVVKPGSMV